MNDRAEYRRIWKAVRADRLRADPTLAPHGTFGTYTNWTCRCEPCTKAASTTRAAQRVSELALASGHAHL